jgi:hypothetical protein
MLDTQKMLRAIINGQSALKQEVLAEVGKLRKEMQLGFEKVDIRFGELEKKVEKNGTRIDKLGISLASLEDDAPTRSEFRKLQKKVSRIELKIASA